jgi:hypothetical protein
LKAGTTIDENGVLTVDPTQTGELVVKATCVGAGLIDGVAGDVYGESIVSITV